MTTVSVPEMDSLAPEELSLTVEFLLSDAFDGFNEGVPAAKTTVSLLLLSKVTFLPEERSLSGHIISPNGTVAYYLYLNCVRISCNP